MARRTLLLELWGLGDAVIATGAVRRLLAAGREVTLACKPAYGTFLRRAYPELRVEPLAAPWTAFTGKYRLWRWPWRELGGALGRLRRARFDEGVSVRPDPRDHLLLALAGARLRTGFPRAGSAALLTRPVRGAVGSRHRVEDWQRLLDELPGLGGALPPHLPAAAYADARPAALNALGPFAVLHAGAGVPVRRLWPEQWRAVWQGLPAELRRPLVLLPDHDGFGAELADLAAVTLPKTSLDGLAAVLAAADYFLGCDSGPAHLAAALGTPTVAVFGPGNWHWFRPFGPHGLAVHEHACPHHPCKDACRFAEARCLRGLPPALVAARAAAHLRACLG